MHREFAAEGLKIVSDLLTSPLHYSKIYATAESIRELPKNIDSEKLECIGAKEMGRISSQKNPEGVFGVFAIPGEAELQSEASLIVLDRVTDPGNLGTILRTAAWFGCFQICCSPKSVDPYNPKVVQASMGAIGSVKIFEREILPFLKEQNSQRVFCTSLEGTPLRKASIPQNPILVFGNESHGIHPEILKTFDQHLTIPGKGTGESLNLAVSLGIVLSHCH